MGPSQRTQRSDSQKLQREIRQCHFRHDEEEMHQEEPDSLRLTFSNMDTRLGAKVVSAWRHTWENAEDIMPNAETGWKNTSEMPKEEHQHLDWNVLNKGKTDTSQHKVNK